MEEDLNKKAGGKEIVQADSDDNAPDELGYQIQNPSLREELVITHYEKNPQVFSVFSNYVYL